MSYTLYLWELLDSRFLTKSWIQFNLLSSNRPSVLCSNIVVFLFLFITSHDESVWWCRWVTPSWSQEGFLRKLFDWQTTSAKGSAWSHHYVLWLAHWPLQNTLFTPVYSASTAYQCFTVFISSKPNSVYAEGSVQRSVRPWTPWTLLDTLHVFGELAGMATTAASGSPCSGCSEPPGPYWSKVRAVVRSPRPAFPFTPILFVLLVHRM